MGILLEVLGAIILIIIVVVGVFTLITNKRKKK